MLFALMFLIMATLFLGSAVLAILLPVLGVALNFVAGGLLALNLCFLLFLLSVRKRWKGAGRMERVYIDSFHGLQHWALLGVKLLLTFGVVWEILVLLTCAGYLIFQPLNLFSPDWLI